MQFTIVKNLKKDTAMSNILKGLLISILLYLIADLLVKYFSIGLTIDALTISLFGSEEEFVEPMSQAIFLEFWHVEIFFIMMILLTLSAIYIRVVNHIKNYKIIFNIVMLSALLSLTALPITYYISSAFIYLYIFGYFIWHLGAIYMASKSIWELYA